VYSNIESDVISVELTHEDETVHIQSEASEIEDSDIEWNIDDENE